MNITYSQIQEEFGAKADSVAEKILAIHRGVGLMDFKRLACGIDCSGCSAADLATIKGLLTKPKEGTK